MVVAAEEVQIARNQALASKAFALVTGNDVGAVLRTLVPCRNLAVGINLGIEVNAGEQCLHAVNAHTAIYYQLVFRERFHKCFKFFYKPIIKLSARVLHRLDTYVGRLIYIASIAKEVENPIIAHGTQCAGFELVLFNCGLHIGRNIHAAAHKAQEVVADGYVRVKAAISTEYVFVAIAPGVGVKVYNACIGPNPLALVGGELL